MVAAAAVQAARPAPVALVEPLPALAVRQAPGTPLAQPGALVRMQLPLALREPPPVAAVVATPPWPLEETVPEARCESPSPRPMCPSPRPPRWRAR